MIEVSWSDFTQEVERIENDMLKTYRKNDEK